MPKSEIENSTFEIRYPSKLYSRYHYPNIQAFKHFNLATASKNISPNLLKIKIKLPTFAVP